jgi:hypothetical protein
VIKISKLIHTADQGEMKNYKNGLKCSKCGFTLKHKEIHDAYLRGKLESPISKGECKEMQKGSV